jgi:photosystem II stability/assembly factor-like uncharacterized protein
MSLSMWDSALKRALWLVLLILVGRTAVGSPWLPFGPDGGDARSFGADPKDHTHIYLGTADGWIYESHNAGRLWQRLARIGRRDDLVLDHILIDRADSKHLLVGAWGLGKTDGGLYVSRDGGVTWASQKDLNGQSIRALTNAPSDPKIFVAGTLEGVYRSTDSGDHWSLISPAGSKEIHEIESAATDPTNPQVIYAGTWHLPWKTEDGGEHWKSIKEGIIDDSDVFSIIVDPKDAKVVYASACSGIYKSEDAGEKFHKVEGIPSTARRTRVLMQDPQNLDTVLAGTTEGLFRTVDAGKTWSRTTGPEVIVNDLSIDPTNRLSILVATERGGVLASLDGGATFQPSNAGFSARQVMGYVEDSRKAGSLYVGVVNDKAWGGVFLSENGGLSWTQQSAGLGGRDVFSLGQASDGTLLAGTGHGIYRLADAVWTRVEDFSSGAGTVPKAPLKVVTGGKAGKRVTTENALKKRSAKHIAVVAKLKAPAMPRGFDGITFAMERAGDTMFAATSTGVFRSGTAGQNWKQVVGPDPALEWRFLSTAKSVVMASSLKTAMRSTDGGETWTPVKLPDGLTRITAACVDGFGGMWIGGLDGVFVSQDGGGTWETLKNLYIRDVNSVFYDAAAERVLITANESSTIAFGVHLPDRKVSFWDAGWKLRFVRPVSDHLVGATLFDGMVIQPRMVASPEAKSP